MNHLTTIRLWVAFVTSILLTGCYVFANSPGKGPYAKQRFDQSAPVITALKQYHTIHGAYPTSLSALVPNEIARLPDLYASDDVINSGTYRRIGASYELGFGYVEGGMNKCRYQPESGWDCHGYL